MRRCAADLGLDIATKLFQGKNKKEKQVKDVKVEIKVERGAQEVLEAHLPVHPYFHVHMDAYAEHVVHAIYKCMYGFMICK